MAGALGFVLAPGIEVRPIRQISGASDFNETFLTDVRIPESCRIGDKGEDWACSMTVLMGGRGDKGIAQLVRLAAATPRGTCTALDSRAVRSTPECLGARNPNASLALG